MIHNEKYVPFLEINVKHGYYSSEMPVELSPDADTRQIMRRAMCVFRQQGPGRWILLHPEGDIEDFSLSFSITPKDPLFYYVTKEAEVQGNATLKTVGQNGVWGILTAKTGGDITLEFRPQEKILEFILIPKYTDASASIFMREARERIELLPPEQTSILKMERVFRVVTKGKVALAQNMPYQFQLFERKDYGERQLSSSISAPHPKESSITDPKETITTYVYY